MNKTIYIIFVLLLVVFVACAPKKPVKEPGIPGRGLFGEAESKYEQSEYPEALKLYRQYVEQYPDTALTPAAYLKLAMSHAELGNFDQARKIYALVIERYPDTSYAGQSRIKILESYEAQGRFKDVIGYREKIPDEKLDQGLRTRADLLAGKAYMALGQFRSAYNFLADAYREAGPETRPELAGRLLAAISALDPEFITSEVKRLDKEPPAGLLIYKQGLDFISGSRLGEALSVFRRFLEDFPEHPLAGHVKEQISSLESAAFFKGHTIGCVLPLTGKYSSFGRQALRGMELALMDASETMEVDPPFKLLVRDSASDPETAARAVEELAKERVAAVVGPIEAFDKAAEAAQKAGIPIIFMSQQADIVEIGEYVFQNFLTPEMQVEAIADYAAGKLGCRRFAVLYPDEPYGEAFLHLFWDKLLENNATLVGAESYNPGHTDFAEPIKKLTGLYYDLPEDLKIDPIPPAQAEALLEALGVKGRPFPGDLFPELEDSLSDHYDFRFPDERMIEKQEPIVDFEALFIPDSPDKAGLIIPQLRYYDIKDIHLLGTNLWHSEKLIEIAGDQIQSAVIPEIFFAQSRRRQVREFVGRFESIYEYKPAFLEAVGYDTAMILFKQISDENVSTRPALRYSLVLMPPYEGLTGGTEFRQSGHADKTLYLLNIYHGRFVELSR
ncbi:MAG: penicillin-binding protein activator [Desulfobacteraceae bacterium]|nr:penicillin-binding protein activator [Desulfobacteraceae bacterium]